MTSSDWLAVRKKPVGTPCSLVPRETQSSMMAAQGV